MNIHAKWKFGSIAEGIFDKKRVRAEIVLQRIFPGINSRLLSIEQNINSHNNEDWKNAVASCRTLIMDIANILNPPKQPEEKSRYINRLKDFISPKDLSKTKKKLLNSYWEELKNRIDI